MPSRRKFLFLYVPGCLFLGGGLVAMKIADYGFSRGIAAGLAAAALSSAALFVVALPALRHPLSADEVKRARLAQHQSHPFAVAAGLAAAALLALLSSLGAEITPALYTFCGGLFLFLTPLAAYGALRGRGLYSVPE